jgi:hypothetical protein
MRQNNSKYHQLYLMLQDADDYFPKEDRKELLGLVKELYKDNQEILNIRDDEGKYGVRYKTVGDDSKFSDKHEQFFTTKSKRDAVFDDWINDRYWDNILDVELQYPVPSPNVHNITKVFKEGKDVYEEIKS